MTLRRDQTSPVVADGVPTLRRGFASERSISAYIVYSFRRPTFGRWVMASGFLRGNGFINKLLTSCAEERGGAEGHTRTLEIVARSSSNATRSARSST